MIMSVVLSGMISIACSSYFRRTAASLVVSYMLILPLALFGVLFWVWTEQFGEFRLVAVSGGRANVLYRRLRRPVRLRRARRLLYPADLGSEGKEVVDLETEAQEAVGLYIKRDEFPDRLFAPPKRTDFIADGTNPIYDKEMRSEIFSQGTLMLRLVIQISMGLAIPGDGLLPVHCPTHTPLVYRLRHSVQYAGRARLFGRQHHERARAADARSAADDADHALADALGEALLGPAGLDRLDCRFCFGPSCWHA